MLRNSFSATLLALSGLRGEYRRTSLGPFWITFSILAQSGIITWVFSVVFEAKFGELWLHVATGLAMWNFMSVSLGRASMILREESYFLRQIALPAWFPIAKLVSYQFFSLVHHLLAVGLLAVLYGRGSLGVRVGFIPLSLIVVLIFVFSVSGVLSLLGAKFGDIPQFINAGMTALFYATPVIWTRSLLPPGYDWIVSANPFAWAIDLIREPLTGSSFEWWKLGSLMTLSAITGVIYLLMLRRIRKKFLLWV